MAMSQVLDATAPQRKPSGNSLPIPWTAVLLLACWLALAQAPLLARHATRLWETPHYQFFPFVLLGSAILAGLRLRELKTLQPGSLWISGGLFLGAWLLFAGGELFYSSWLAGVSCIVLLIALTYLFGGTSLLRVLLPAWVLLLLVIPLPLGLDSKLILALQAITAQWASAVLDLFGVFHHLSGNVVNVDGRPLLVEEACSGINSLFSILACAIFLVFLTRRGWLRGGFLIVSSVGWVLVANVARVVGIVMAETRWEINLTKGWRHDAVGLLVFAVAVFLIWSTDQLLSFLLNPSKPEQAEPEDAETPQQEDSEEPGVSTGLTDSLRSGPWILAWSFGGAYLALFVAHLALYGSPSIQSEPAAMTERVEQLDENSLPENLGKWKRESFQKISRNPGSAFGEFSRLWVYRSGGLIAQVSVDYPFPAWHDLTSCYIGQGWKVEGQVVHKNSEVSSSATPRACLEMRLSKAPRQAGFLLFSHFDREGELLHPRSTELWFNNLVHVKWNSKSAWARWGHLLTGGPKPPSDPEGPFYQVQVFAQFYHQPGEKDQQQLRELFARVQNALLEPAARATAHRREK